MSWLYVPGLEASNSESNLPNPALVQSVTWRGKPIRSLSHSPVFARIFSTMRQSGLTSKPSTASPGVALWIASLVATPASLSAWPVDAKGKPIPDTCGPISGASSLKSNPDPAFLKMWKDTFNLDLNRYGETFATWVTRLKQEYSARTRWGPPSYGSDFSSWPTATHSDSGAKITVNSLQPGLIGAASNWATPTARDWKDGFNPIKHYRPQEVGSTQLRATDYLGLQAPRHTMPGKKFYASPRALNPRFVEWLMGFPIGWTDLQPLETQSFQQWQQRHGDNLERGR